MSTYDEDEEWLFNELLQINEHQQNLSNNLTSQLLRSPLHVSKTSTSFLNLFDVQLTAPTHTLKKVYPLLPDMNSAPGIVDINVVSSPFKISGVAESSVYDQQKSTLQNGKSGREGGVSTALDFLPGGMKQATVSTVLGSSDAGSNSTRLLPEDHLILSCYSSHSTVLGDDDKKKLLLVGGRAPGLLKGLTLEDEKLYLSGKSINIASETTTDDMLEGTKNQPDLLGQFNGAINDEEFNTTVRSKLRDARGMNNINKNSNAIAFTNIFADADIDEEHYLLGSSSDEDSSDDEDRSSSSSSSSSNCDEEKQNDNLATTTDISLEEEKFDRDNSTEDQEIDALIFESQLKLSSAPIKQQRKYKWARTDLVSDILLY